MSFRDLLLEQLSAARDAASASDLLGQVELGEWWRWRVMDLERYLADTMPSLPSLPSLPAGPAAG